jgi:hypothetical protein
MRKFAWKKDPRDERDYLRGKAVFYLPNRVDLSDILPSVRDQGNLGSCTGFGIGGNLTGCALQQEAIDEWFSPTWIYNGARLLEDSLPYDDGAYPRDCLEFIREHGCLLEHFRPYKDTLDKTSPLTWGLNDDAAKWPIVEYARCVDGVEGIKSALVGGHLVSIGAPWYYSWMDTDSDGVVDDDYSSMAGGHEFLCYGYDDTKQLLYCQNSWGTSWGVGGRFAIPYSAIAAWKLDGGYDAHLIIVDWEPGEPEPGPIPVKKSKVWLFIAIGVVIAIAVASILFL